MLISINITKLLVQFNLICGIKYLGFSLKLCFKIDK